MEYITLIVFVILFVVSYAGLEYRKQRIILKIIDNLRDQIKHEHEHNLKIIEINRKVLKLHTMKIRRLEKLIHHIGHGDYLEHLAAMDYLSEYNLTNKPKPSGKPKLYVVEKVKK